MKFILGRSGSGKTTHCLNEIKKYIEQDFDKPLILIVPEQFTFETEKKLINALGTNGIINAEVLSFKRLAYKIFSLNNIKINLLSETGKMMLIYFIMQKFSKDLKVLKGADKNVGLINTVVDEISEFKRYNITPEMLKDIDLKNELSNSKIKDLYLIYNEYESHINENYIDSNDELTILAQTLKADKYLNGARIWIDEFDGFTPQELEIISELTKKCDITLSITNGNDDYFELNNNNINKLQKISKDNIDIINLTENLRAKNEELSHIEANIFKLPYEKYDKKLNHITVSKYNNSYDEIESIAQKIRKELMNNDGLKYENIAILTRNIEDYKNIFKMVFELYNIPYFFDDKKQLSLEPLMTMILSFIDIISSNYRYEDIFSYLKTGLVDIDNSEDIDLLENYVLKWGIKGKTWENDFVFEDKNLSIINSTRAKIIIPIINFKNKFKGKKSVNDIIKALFEFLEEIETYQIIKNKINNLKDSKDSYKLTIAQEYAKVWNHLMNIFDDMSLTIGEEKISFDKFKSIFKMGISSEEIALIPTTLDRVIIGDVERTRTASIKSLYVVGVNDGNFPRVFADEGFINDLERQTLLDSGIEIAKDTKKLLTQEYFNIYKSLSIPSDNLNLSFPISNLEGKSLRPALLINQIKSMFPNLEIEDYVLNKKIISYSKNGTFPIFLNEFRKNIDNKTININNQNLYNWYLANDSERFNNVLQGIDYSNSFEYILESTAKQLYGKTIKSSVSKLENFKSCPFSFYLRYGMNLKEREEFKLGIPDIGSLMHEIIETFSKKVLEDDINIRELTREESDKIVSNITDQVLVSFRNSLFKSTAKLRNLSIRLKSQIQKMIWIIIFQIKSGEFNMIGSEVEFGKGSSEYPPLIIELSTGEKIELSGKVDRIDLANTEKGNYLRIVDYKSSSKEIKLSDVFYGIQLQLVTYMDVIAKDNLIPGGVLYLKIDDPILKTQKRISKEEIEEKIIASLKMNGLVISDARLIKAMDSEMINESNVLNLKQNKDGSYAKMPTISSEAFTKLREHIKTTIKQIGDEIIKGKIENAPLVCNGKKLPCEYCAFMEICNFDKSLGNKYRYANDLKDEEIIKKLMNGD